jgi:GrpB-like predicted nucleotidyltransferase (UPF0157 family)
MDARPIVVVLYDEAWPSLFLEEQTRIERALGPLVERIEHVGSTAVPGLTSKPIIDIMVGVRSLREADRCIEPLGRLSYEYRGEVGVPGRLFFRKGDPRTHHLHIAEVGGEFWVGHLAFRAYLRTHPQTAREYARLKHELADSFRADWTAYAEGKSAFILEVLRRASEVKGTNFRERPWYAVP